MENAASILEKGLLHNLEEMEYFSPDQFNRDLWKHLDKLSSAPFAKKNTRRCYESCALREQPVRWMKAAIPAAGSRGPDG